MQIDRNKCGTEYSLCSKCIYDSEPDGWRKCEFCTSVVSVGYDMLLCGIPVGHGITYYHKNFETVREA